jgi:hypothetical protein
MQHAWERRNMHKVLIEIKERCEEATDSDMKV